MEKQWGHHFSAKAIRIQGYFYALSKYSPLIFLKQFKKKNNNKTWSLRTIKAKLKTLISYLKNTGGFKINFYIGQI